jgi:hypothetical protein
MVAVEEVTELPMDENTGGDVSTAVVVNVLSDEVAVLEDASVDWILK